MCYQNGSDGDELICCRGMKTTWTPMLIGEARTRSEPHRKNKRLLVGLRYNSHYAIRDTETSIRPSFMKTRTWAETARPVRYRCIIERRSSELEHHRKIARHYVAGRHIFDWTLQKKQWWVKRHFMVRNCLSERPGVLNQRSTSSLRNTDGVLPDN